MNFILSLVMVAFPLLTYASVEENACKNKENIRLRMSVITSNIANVNTTRTPEGGPYHKKDLECVGLLCQVKDSLAVLVKYEPGHLDADADGYVTYPDINVMHEMKEMIRATRDFEDTARVCN